MSAAKVERLLNLSAALLAAERPLTAEEIRQRVPGYPAELASFRRAFERDKDDLRAMGVPLHTRKVTYRGRRQDAYVVPAEEYSLRDPGLEPDELAALHLAANAIKLEGVSGIEALWKLGGEGGPPAAGAAGGGADLVAGGEPLANVPADGRLVQLFTGLVDRVTVGFRYHGTERLVEPHRLDYRRGRWYLSGHDRARGEGRSFRVDRIEGDVTVRDTDRFAPPPNPHPGVELQPWQLGGDEPVWAQLRVDADQAPWAVRYLGPDAVEGEGPEGRADACVGAGQPGGGATDGGVTFRMEVRNRAAFRSFVLTFLDHAEILGPPELRHDLLDWLGGVP